MCEPTVEVASIIVRVGTNAITMKPTEAKALRDELLKMYPLTDVRQLLREEREMKAEMSSLNDHQL